MNRKRAENWEEYGLRAWLVLFVLTIAGRVSGAYATPWLVILAPVILPIAAYVAWLGSIVALAVALAVWILVPRWLLNFLLGRS